MRTIAQRWAEFEAAILDPIGAGDLQRKETRRAFYAGFQASLTAGIEMAEESGDDDEAGVLMIAALHEECLQFSGEIAMGRA